MKHYVLGLIVGSLKDRILLVEKLRPEWMKGRWNGIGGKVEGRETPLEAMHRESIEETGRDWDFKHTITFVCPGGTVFVFLAISGNKRIIFQQIEDEKLMCVPLDELPDKVMSNLKWIIPLSFSTVQKPIILHQEQLGVDGDG